ncbi:uncharacterized protein PFL1_05296 [Pseudozyma flocculosa PF-1]|uniref:Uncharacterized protein n=1 Tax=Pseudozyma flocculosa PF-1 TaxID=1277687 RepID=A0A061H2R8_9BASI|nr:uncharacterized protein PFL1_05296 [Pseudozyma flocculosa PF-1]EPQ27012.1 hypothetical protein PFL1_05296 [Pseudozyma flocculosa PF-1]
MASRDQYIAYENGEIRATPAAVLGRQSRLDIETMRVVHAHPGTAHLSGDKPSLCHAAEHMTVSLGLPVPTMDNVRRKLGEVLHVGFRDEDAQRQRGYSWQAVGIDDDVQCTLQRPGGPVEKQPSLAACLDTMQASLYGDVGIQIRIDTAIRAGSPSYALEVFLVNVHVRGTTQQRSVRTILRLDSIAPGPAVTDEAVATHKKRKQNPDEPAYNVNGGGRANSSSSSSNGTGAQPKHGSEAAGRSGAPLASHDRRREAEVVSDPRVSSGRTPFTFKASSGALGPDPRPQSRLSPDDSAL